VNAERTPLIQKFILAVLVLILVCLVLILARSNKRPEPLAAGKADTEEIAPAVPEEVRQLPTTNIPRVFKAPPVKPPASAPSERASPVAGFFRPAVSAGPEKPAATPAAYTTLVSPLPVSGQPKEPIAEPPASRAQIFGRVFLSGTPRPEVRINLDSTCGRLWSQPPTTRHYILGADKGLANVLVYIKAGIGPVNFDPNAPEPVLENIRCFFEPYVIGVQAGQKFKVTNSDSVLHNVHATPKLNREFNFAMASRGSAKEASFGTPELSIRVKCDVHPWEFSYIHVLNHPFFAITDTNGVFALPSGLPGGRYLVSALHLKAGEAVQEIELRDRESQNIDFVLNATR